MWKITTGSIITAAKDGSTLQFLRSDTTVEATTSTTISFIVNGTKRLTLNISDIDSIDGVKPYGAAGQVIAASGNTFYGKASDIVNQIEGATKTPTLNEVLLKGSESTGNPVVNSVAVKHGDFKGTFLDNDELTADRTYQPPDADGTLALESAASGTFTSDDGKIITVTNGIITDIDEP